MLLRRLQTLLRKTTHGKAELCRVPEGDTHLDKLQIRLPVFDQASIVRAEQPIVAVAEARSSNGGVHGPAITLPTICDVTDVTEEGH